MSEDQKKTPYEFFIEQIKRLPDPLREDLLRANKRNLKMGTMPSDEELLRVAKELKIALDDLPQLVKDLYRAAREAPPKEPGGEGKEDV